MKKNTEIIESMLKDLLPHGSGINGNWNITTLKNGKIQASNYFEAMNECGMYCHCYDFTVTYIFNDVTGFTFDRFNFHGQKEYSCCGYDLKNYLIELLYSLQS